MVRKLMIFPFWVLVIWAGLLCWLLFDVRYLLFLSPKFSFLIYTSLILSLLFAFSFSMTNAPQIKDEFSKGMILLLPVYFIIAVQDNTLGNYALSKRTLTPLQTHLAQNNQSNEKDTASGSEPVSGEYPLVSMTQLIRNWETYAGKSVCVEGIFSESIVNHEELAAVFRYIISCCAADAQPIGVFMSSKLPGEALKNNDWVRASGKVRMTDLDGYRVVYMDVESVEKKEKPSKNAVYIF